MATPRKYIKRANINYSPSSQAFTELSKAASKIVPRAGNIGREAIMMAIPIPGPKKIITGAKVVNKVIKTVRGTKKVAKTSRGSSLPIPGMGVKSKAERTRVNNSKFDERIIGLQKDLKKAKEEGKSQFQINKLRGEIRKVKVQQKSYNQMYNRKGK
jgi:hypothetical protein